jgi:hypothetical protein
VAAPGVVAVAAVAVGDDDDRPHRSRCIRARA